AVDGIRYRNVTGVQTCALPISFIYQLYCFFYCLHISLLPFIPLFYHESYSGQKIFSFLFNHHVIQNKLKNKVLHLIWIYLIYSYFFYCSTCSKNAAYEIAIEDSSSISTGFSLIKDAITPIIAIR